MEKEQIKELLEKSGYKSSTVRSFVNGNRDLFTERQRKFIRSMLRAKAPIKFIVDPSLSNNSNKQSNTSS